MSIASRERDILHAAREVFYNPRLRVKDILEWSSGPIEEHDGEESVRVDRLGIYVSIQPGDDKRPR